MAKELFPNKIIWLASYPKSGNTWFRAFLTALLNDGEVEINDMDTDGIFSSRDIFELMSDMDSRDMYDEEVRTMLPDVFRQWAKEQKRTAIVKVHDAYSYNAIGDPITPEDVTHCAIYLIRNPLDVVASLANHNNSTLDEAISLMCKPDAYLARQKGNLNTGNQLPQLMYDWSNHVKTWTRLPGFPVYVVRYEDMLKDSLGTFKKVVQQIGWTYSDEEIEAAISASSFEKLSKQEKEKGFHEKSKTSKVFFREGKMGNWKVELTNEQALTIVNAHHAVMDQFGYNNI